MLDFTPKPAAEFSAAFEAIIDEALLSKEAAEKADYQAKAKDHTRPAIGAGSLGNECLRAIGYKFHRTPVDPGREFSGRLLRIFRRGHVMEDIMAEYIRLAGFTLLTHRPSDGKQFRWDAAKYEDGKGRIKGMVDGVITEAPYASGVVTPCVWENKELGNKGWTKLASKGLKAYGGDYYPQTQLNMFYLGLHENPALFTAKNADTQQIYAEKIPFDAEAAQAASDKGVKVVQSRHPEELPRVAKVSTDYRCKFCDFPQRCWAEPAAEPVTSGAWSWGQ